MKGRQPRLSDKNENDKRHHGHQEIRPLEPTHSQRFLEILGKHYPTWREARAELNELPLSAEVWKE